MGIRRMNLNLTEGDTPSETGWYLIELSKPVQNGTKYDVDYFYRGRTSGKTAWFRYHFHHIKAYEKLPA